MMFSRRALLKGLSSAAGAALLSPLLSQIARAQGTAPKRFVFVLEGNSAEPVNFLSQNARSAFENSASATLGAQRWFYRSYDALSSVLSVDETDFATAPALASIVDDASGVSLQNDAAVVFGLSNRIAGGGHSCHHGALGCHRSSSAAPGGQTIDAFLAALSGVRQGSPFEALRVGISGGNAPLNYETCAFARGRAAAAMLLPTTAFNSLFSSVASAAGQKAFQQRNDLLGFARRDVSASLQNFRGGSQERAKLEAYLTSVQSLIARQNLLQDLEAETQSLSQNKPIDPDVNPLITSGAPLDRLQAQFDIVEAALKGGLTNVAVVASGTGNSHFNLRYSSISNVARHDLQHTSGSSATSLNAIHAVTRRHVEMTTRLARNLKAVSEGEGTMLDNTAIVFMSDNGEQHHSTASEWPMLLLGGSAMGLQTGGRTLFYPGLGQGSHRQVSNFFNTLGHAAGASLNDFGSEGPTRVAEGPLSELMS